MPRIDGTTSSGSSPMAGPRSPIPLPVVRRGSSSSAHSSPVHPHFPQHRLSQPVLDRRALTQLQVQGLPPPTSPMPMLTASLSSTSSNGSSALGTAMMANMDMDAGSMVAVAVMHHQAMPDMMNMTTSMSMSAGGTHQAPWAMGYPVHPQNMQHHHITPEHPAELHPDLLHHDPQALMRSSSTSSVGSAVAIPQQQAAYMAGMDQIKYDPSLAQPTQPLVLME